MRSATRLKTGRDREYLAFIASQPCAICRHYGLTQTSRTECAHVGLRGISQKCSDLEAIPLCGERHHRLGPTSHHAIGRHFWKHHGLDKDVLVAYYQRLFKEMES